jgi:hypothetical protein
MDGIEAYLDKIDIREVMAMLWSLPALLFITNTHERQSR